MGLDQADVPVDTAPAPRRRIPSLRRSWPLLVGAVALVLAAAIVVTDRHPGPPAITRAEVAQTTKTVVDKAIATAKAAPADSVQVYDTILPSLVLIRTEGNKADDASLGSGVIINAQGAVITANHVIEGASSITVSFIDGSTANATVTSSQPDDDIAVLQPDKLPDVVVPAVMGGGVRVGDETFAVGHPLGLARSMSAGVISGLNRAIPLDETRELKNLIQFDAAVNPGNSGGPLLNRNGQVVGIVTALANPSKQGYFIGIGFAVPIATAAGGAGGPAQ